MAFAARCLLVTPVAMHCDHGHGCNDTDTPAPAEARSRCHVTASAIAQRISRGAALKRSVSGSHARAAMVVLTQEQADAAMAVNQTWPYRGQEDGWFLAHGGLRLDMAGAHFWGCVWAGQGGALVGSSGQCPDKPNSPHPTAPACRP